MIAAVIHKCYFNNSKLIHKSAVYNKIISSTRCGETRLLPYEISLTFSNSTMKIVIQIKLIILICLSLYRVMAANIFTQEVELDGMTQTQILQQLMVMTIWMSRSLISHFVVVHSNTSITGLSHPWLCSSILATTIACCSFHNVALPPMMSPLLAPPSITLQVSK